MLSFSISHPDLIKFHYFLDTTTRGDRGAKAEEIRGETGGDFTIASGEHNELSCYCELRVNFLGTSKCGTKWETTEVPWSLSLTYIHMAKYESLEGNYTWIGLDFCTSIGSTCRQYMGIERIFHGKKNVPKFARF
jgi:hypothetical protein